MKKKRSRSRSRSCCLWPIYFLTAAAVLCCAILLSLPDVASLRTETPKVTALMRIRSREWLAKDRVPDRRQRFVPLSRISKNLQHAVLVAEDDAFYQHPGYDLKQIRRSIEIDWKERRLVRGASTITQQLARNIYLSPSRNPIRKLRELLICLRLEKALTKDRILELYLNLIEWGVNVYGAEAACRLYYGKGCRSLLPEEAATLAAIIPNPRRRDPRKHLSLVEKRKKRILWLMRRRGYLKTADYQSALSRRVRTRPLKRKAT